MFCSKGDRIYEQMKKMGASLDWSRACFTMDDVRSQINYCLTCFVKIYTLYMVYSLQFWIVILVAFQTGIFLFYEEYHNKEIKKS